MAVAAALSILSASCTPGGGSSRVPGAAKGSSLGGTLVVIADRPGSVDPLDAYEPTGLLIARTICDTLLDVDPVGGSLRGNLASTWSVSDEGTQLSFKIRKGARFSDGTKVRASDVAYSLSRAANPSFAGRAAELLSPIAGWAELRGEREAKDPRARRKLLGVRAITEDTVQVNLSVAKADVVRLFTHPVTAPVSEKATTRDPEAAQRRPVCSGPYRLEQPWSSSADVVRLDRVKGYVGRSSARTRGGAGYVDRIEIHARGAAAVDARVDVVVDPGGDVSGLDRVTGPAPGVELLGLPHGATSPFRDRDLRRALSIALDRAALVERTTPGDRVAATGFIPPGIVGTARKNGCDDVPASGDPARARRVLEEAAIDPDAFPLRLTFDDQGPHRAIAEEVAAQWREGLGAVVEVVPATFDEIVAKATLGGGLDGPFRLSWAAPYPSADAHLAPLFESGSTNVANFGRWNDPAFDRALQREAREAIDEQDRVLEHRRLEDLLCREMPAIPLTFDLAVLAVRSDRVYTTGDRYVDPTTGLPNLREVWLTP